MPKRHPKFDDDSHLHEKRKKPQESSDLTIEPPKIPVSGKSKENAEEMSNLNNLIDAARIVEGNETTQEPPKKGKTKAPRKREASKVKKTVRGTKVDKEIATKNKKQEKSDINSDSDSERESEILSLKNTMSLMMAKLEKLENSKRKRKSKKPKKLMDETESGDEDDVKPNKSPKKENVSILKSSESAMRVPDYQWSNGLFQYQQMMMLQQQMMYNQQHGTPFPFSQPMLQMMQAAAASNSLTNPIPTNSVTPKKRSNDNSSSQSSVEKNGNEKSERRKESSSGRRPSGEKDVSREYESDASEVYEPSKKDGNLEKYFSVGQTHPSKSFLGFVDEINKDENKSIQSRVVSSTKRHSETTKLKRSTQEHSKRNIEKQNSKIEADLPPSNNIAGILMNLMPNQKSSKATDKESDSSDKPHINNTLKSLFGYNFESDVMNKAAENIMSKQNSIPDASIIPYAKFRPEPVIDRKHYVDNTEWMRNSVRDLYLQDQDGDTVLHILIAKEDQYLAIDVIKKMNGYKLDILNALGQTPLHLAMYTKSVKVIETLLQHGADIGIVDAHGNSPMHIACEENSLEMLKVLFDYRVGQQDRYNRILQIRNNQGMAAIHIATSQANLPILKYLASQNVDLNIQESRSGNTPLLMALAKNNWKLADFFLDNGCNVNIPNFSNHYPLHLAVQGNEIVMVKELLNRGAEYGSKANEYEHGIASTEIKALLAKEMRKRRRMKLKYQDGLT